ncbi:transcription factor GATA-4, partial [Silurus asotus]
VEDLGARAAVRCPGIEKEKVSDNLPAVLHHSGLSPQPGHTAGMYQGLGMAGSPGAYETSFVHNAAASPVYVPSARVIPALPYLQAHGGGSQASSAASCHPAWTQPGPDPAAASYSASSQASSRFTFSSSSATPARESAVYANANAPSGREHYGARGLASSYSAPYPAYVNPGVGGTWAASHFDGSVLHSLQSAGATGVSRHPNM